MWKFRHYLVDKELNVYNRKGTLIVPRIYRRSTIKIKGITYTSGQIASRAFYNNKTLYLKDKFGLIVDKNVKLCNKDWFSLDKVKGYIFNEQGLCVNKKKCELIEPCTLFDPITKESFKVYGFRPNIQIKLKDLKCQK